MRVRCWRRLSRAHTPSPPHSHSFFACSPAHVCLFVWARLRSFRRGVSDRVFQRQRVGALRLRIPRQSHRARVVSAFQVSIQRTLLFTHTCVPVARGRALSSPRFPPANVTGMLTRSRPLCASASAHGSPPSGLRGGRTEGGAPGGGRGRSGTGERGGEGLGFRVWRASAVPHYYISTRAPACTHARTCTHTRTHAHTHTRTHARSGTRTHPRTRAYTHTHRRQRQRVMAPGLKPGARILGNRGGRAHVQWGDA